MDDMNLIELIFSFEMLLKYLLLVSFHVRLIRTYHDNEVGLVKEFNWIKFWTACKPYLSFDSELSKSHTCVLFYTEQTLV